MAEPNDKPEGFLRRWSQRKLAAAREAQGPGAVPTEGTVAEAPIASPAPAPAAPAADARAAAAPEAEAKPPLPDVETLTFDSDFQAFLSPQVEEGTRRAALRKLFSDPRFNVQDGLDVYIDDYNKFEPLTPDVLKQLAHARYVFDPPKTRVNEQGWVEDVPDPPVQEVAEPDREQPVDDAAKIATNQAPAPLVEAQPAETGTEACQNPSEPEPPGVLPEPCVPSGSAVSPVSGPPR